MMPSEITFELTDFCPEGCRYCSSAATNDWGKATFLGVDTVTAQLDGKRFDHIILSGGEPLAHPQFYWIHRLCALHTDDVVVYSSLIRHLVYNAGVIDGVYLEANITVTPETDVIKILKRVEQGRERHRPEVSFSRNHDGPCDCSHRVVRPSGVVVLTPCSKERVA